MASLTDRCYTTEAIKQNIRTDGRQRLDYRYFTINTNVLPHTTSSTRVHLGNTDVLCTASIELSNPPEGDSGDAGVIQFGVQASQHAYPVTLHHTLYTPQQITDMTTALTHQLTQVYTHNTSAIDLTQLCVIPGQSVWWIYIDCTVFVADGAVLDALSMAVNTCLHHITLPYINVVTNPVSNEQEIQMMADEPGTQIKLDTLPLAVTLSLCGDDYVVDCTAVEEVVCGNSLVMAVSDGGTVQAVHTDGTHTGVTLTQTKQLRHAAQVIGKQLHSAVREVVQANGHDKSAANVDIR